jgi:hypothetical protein
VNPTAVSGAASDAGNLIGMPLNDLIAASIHLGNEHSVVNKIVQGFAFSSDSIRNQYDLIF